MTLSRKAFRDAVFARDGYKCIVCGDSAEDAHHIMERRLWEDGGYYLNNGASVCEPCHFRAEQTLISCEELRELAGINTVLLPEHLYQDQKYDKWGNPILPNGTRLRGELFDDGSVQKVLTPVLHLFTKYVKYPRTWHLPWSPGATEDDRIIRDTSHFEGKEVIVTVKMDGECTNLYDDYIHARSLDYSTHPSRDRIKELHSRIGWELPDGWRICGENMIAAHSIKYENLEDFFQVFSIWDDRNVCLSWEETLEWANILGLTVVPVLYQGTWDESHIRSLHSPMYKGDECEGYVVRLSSEFHYKDFRYSVGKYVREGHVGNHGFWSKRSITYNQYSGSG